MRRSRKPLGLYQLFRSVFDGAWIALVFNCFNFRDDDHTNIKTGEGIQSYIMPLDVAPIEATKTGADESVCSDCHFRPSLDGGCYVQVWKAPTQVWKCLWDSFHPDGPKGYIEKYIQLDLAKHAELFNDEFLRYGSWGDPAAIPWKFWERFNTIILPRLRGNAGYTRQWERFPEFKTFLMASCHSIEEKEYAESLGWRAFEVTDGTTIREGSFLCPASKENDHAIQCNQCLQCDGKDGENDKRKSVIIPAHGIFGKQIIQRMKG